jgi:hypothetical protein
VGFPGGISDKKNILESAPPYAGPNRPSRKPVTFKRGPIKRLSRSQTIPQNMRKHRFARTYKSRSAPHFFQLVPPDAARQTDSPMVAVDHPAVSARKSQKRHKARR